MPISPRAGHARVDAPEEVVRQLLGRRRLERLDATALRVHAGEHRADHAVLAGCVHALQHEQHRTPRLGVQASVQNAETRDELLEPLEPLGLRVRAGARAGVAACEMRRLARLHTELVEQLHRPEYAVTAVTTSSPAGAFEWSVHGTQARRPDRGRARRVPRQASAQAADGRSTVARCSRVTTRASAPDSQRRADPEAIPMSLRVGAFLSPRQPPGPLAQGAAPCRDRT